MKKPVMISDIHQISQIWKYELENMGRQVIGYVTKREDAPKLLDGIPVFDLGQMSALYHHGVLFDLVLPRERFCTQGQSRLFQEFKRLGIKDEDILLTTRLSDHHHRVERYMVAKYLPYLEFHVADHCNLNCAACEHFSALADKKIHGLEEIKSGLDRLSKYIDDIGVIRILGGEPLLNPDLPEIIRLTRSIYKNSDIHIVTNGLLLDSMPGRFYEACVDLNAMIHISYYPPMTEKQGEIETILNDWGVKYLFSEFNSTFRKKYTLTSQSDKQTVFENCIQACCNNLYCGEMATCFLPFTQKYFNKRFGVDIPTSGAISLFEEDLDTEKLKRHLQMPLERCAYCKAESRDVRWHVSGGVDLEDWIVD